MAPESPLVSSPLLAWDAQVALQRLEGELGLMKEVVGLMVQTMGEHQADLAAAAQADDFPRMRQHTHAMLASLKVLGFDEQARLFEDFERAAVLPDKATCQRLAPQVQALWSGIIEVLAHYHDSQA